MPPGACGPSHPELSNPFGRAYNVWTFTFTVTVTVTFTIAFETKVYPANLRHHTRAVQQSTHSYTLHSYTLRGTAPIHSALCPAHVLDTHGTHARATTSPPRASLMHHPHMHQTVLSRATTASPTSCSGPLPAGVRFPNTPKTQASRAPEADMWGCREEEGGHSGRQPLPRNLLVRLTQRQQQHMLR